MGVTAGWASPTAMTGQTVRPWPSGGMTVARTARSARSAKAGELGGLTCPPKVLSLDGTYRNEPLLEVEQGDGVCLQRSAGIADDLLE